jgi:hypothetical protein
MRRFEGCGTETEFKKHPIWQITLLPDATLCSLRDCYRRFRGMCCYKIFMFLKNGGQHVLPKRRWIYTRTQNIIFQRTVIFTGTTGDPQTSRHISCNLNCRNSVIVSDWQTDSLTWVSYRSSCSESHTDSGVRIFLNQALDKDNITI